MTRSSVAVSTIALLSTIVVPGTGCSSRQAYPQTWPAQTVGRSDCRQFAGRYRNAEDAAQPLASSLTRLLFEGSAPQQAEWVTFALPDRERLQIDITSTLGDLWSVVLTSDQKQFECDDGVLVIKAGGRWTGNVNQLGFGVGQSAVSLELRIAGGYLAVKEKTRTIGVINVMPWRYVREEWHRFERVPS